MGIGIVRGLLVTLDHGDRQAGLERVDSCNQQRGLAGAGTGNEIQRQSSQTAQSCPIFIGIAAVLRQNILLDPHQPHLADAADMDCRRAAAKMQIAIGVVVDMGFLGAVAMTMAAIMAMIVVIVRMTAIGITVSMIVMRAMGMTWMMKIRSVG